MNKLLIIVMLSISIPTFAQNYNNEWINYSKTYYKCTVTENKLHRLSHSVLQSVGLGAVPAEHFQLFKNGQQVPIYTSVVSGVLGSSDYLEFWASPNSGFGDTELYDVATAHLNKKWSLINDTASYFLTVNTITSQNLRLETVVNNVPANTLPVETNFKYTVGNYPKNNISNGFASVVGEELHSSIYDKGEGWSTFDISASSIYSSSINNLYPDLSATTLPIYKFGGSGRGTNVRNFLNKINNITVLDQSLNFYEAGEFSATFPLTVLSSGNAALTVQNTSTTASDKMVIAYQEITYPRLFNFGGATNFDFWLEPNINGNYVEITNFNAESSIPVLYDLTNGKRYMAEVVGSILKFALLPSTVRRNLILANQATTNIVNVATLHTKNFINLMQASNQGNYLIITSKAIHTLDANNAIEKYKTYRSSAIGGAFNVKVIDAEDLYDQYAFGVNKHPAALRNYFRQTRNVFTSAPKFVLIIGRGVAYNEARLNPDNFTNQLNLIPTFGYPASDNLLTANPGTHIQITPIGRLGVINNTEVEDYLNKVKQYELNLADNNFTIANKAWMKNSTYVSGSSEPFLQTIIDNYQLDYKKAWKDTSVGGNGYLFTKSTAGGATPLTNDFMEHMWNNGHSVVEYFGHSSATTLEFNLDDPTIYNNQGKYPFMLINGCNAGNFFVYNPFRISTTSGLTLSEKFVFAPNKGSIGFIASTSYGVVNYLHYYNINFQKEVSGTSYGKSIGEVMKAASTNMFSLTGSIDFYAQSHAEQILLQGDPALKFNTSYPKQDYVIESQTVSLPNNFITVANDSFTVNMHYMNLGKAVKNDSITISVKREFPNGNIVTVYNKRVAGAYYSDTMDFRFAIAPLTDKGLNKIIIKLDAGNEKDEMSETNNTITKDVFINELDAKPIHPYNYAIVNTLPVKLIASTANPLATARDYYMELDTTAFFNSPLKQQQTISQIGGVVEFAPIASLIPNKVYYWRIASSGNTPLHWNIYSFTYLPTSTYGFNQAHLFQHLQSTHQGIKLDSITRIYSFDSIGQNISIRNAVFPWGNEQAHYTIAVNQDAYIRGICELNSITFNVFNPQTGQAWVNTGALYGSSGNICVGGAQYNFTYVPNTLEARNVIDNFIKNVVPAGYYVVVRNFNYFADSINAASNWAGDAVANGNGQSMYNTFKNVGFTEIDNVHGNNAFIFVFRKNTPSYIAKQILGSDETERISGTTTFKTPDTIGYITSPKFGPAKQWNEVHWRGTKVDTTLGDNPKLSVYGINANYVATKLFELDTTQLDYNISSINATQYPYVQLKMKNSDPANGTPWQLNYWRLNYVPVPEGAVAPNVDFYLKDTIQYAETINTVLAFKNISNASFDSVKVKIYLLDSNQNLVNTYLLPKQKNVGTNDTIKIMFQIPNINLAGKYTVLFDVNPDNDQYEQEHFNNLLYKNMYVVPNILPVTWLRVNAVLQHTKSLITWSTATEINTKKFIIEHSIDGRNFIAIGETTAAGNSSIQKDYSFLHHQPIVGVNYYRIKQIDVNGDYKYSIIVTVVNRENTTQTIIGPNPVSDILNIFEPSLTWIKTIEIIDANGKLMTRLNINQQISSIPVPIANFSAGGYVLKINYKNETKTYKFIKN